MKTACTLSPSISFPSAARRPLSTPPEKETSSCPHPEIRLLSCSIRSSSVVPVILRTCLYRDMVLVAEAIMLLLVPKVRDTRLSTFPSLIIMETESGDGAFFMPLRRTPEYTRQVNMRVRSVDRSVFLTASGKG